MKQISIPYFPSGIRYTSPLLIGLGIYLWVIGYPVWFGIFTLVVILILTTSYVTEIDPEKKEFRDFLSVLWVPFEEETTKFNKVEKIIITKVNQSHMLNSRSRSRQLDWSSFTGALLTDDNKTLEVLTRTDKKELITGLKVFAEFLKVDVEDQTTSQYFVIDLSKY